MVNYKLLQIVVLAAAVVLSSGAPAADCSERHFDQRQNGTENYRLNIDGVVIAVAPADSLLEAASDIYLSELLNLDDLDDIPLHELKPPSNDKPEPTKPETPAKPADDQKPEEPAKPAEAPLSDVSLSSSEPKSQKKDSGLRKREKAQRLKQRLANMLIPLLRRTRHH